jgi:hypothetical protein
MPRSRQSRNVLRATPISPVRTLFLPCNHEGDKIGRGAAWALNRAKVAAFDRATRGRRGRRATRGRSPTSTSNLIEVRPLPAEPTSSGIAEDQDRSRHLRQRPSGCQRGPARMVGVDCARGSRNVVPPRRRGLRCGRDKVRPPTPRRADRPAAVPQAGNRGRSLAGLEPAARQEPRRRPAEQRGRTGEPNPHGAAGCARGGKHEGLLQSAGKLSSACWSSSAPLRATRHGAWARYGAQSARTRPCPLLPREQGWTNFFVGV